MSKEATTRLLLEQDGRQYRFLKFDARPDGSLVISQDRSSRKAEQALRFDQSSGIMVPDEERTSHAKVTCHITGEIHYDTSSRRTTFFIEPLFDLPIVRRLAYFSIPRVSKLDPFEADVHKQGSLYPLKIPAEMDDRATFSVHIAPLGTTTDRFGIILGYETYAVLVLQDSLNIAPDMKDHFVHGVIDEGILTERAIGIAEAEIAFRLKAHGGPVVLREDSGAYVVLTVQPMHRSPDITVNFNRPDLVAVQDESWTKTHKVRFWIHDKGGRNRREDLRNHITSVLFDAEITGAI